MVTERNATLILPGSSRLRSLIRSSRTARSRTLHYLKLCVLRKKTSHPSTGAMRHLPLSSSTAQRAHRAASTGSSTPIRHVRSTSSIHRCARCFAWELTRSSTCACRTMRPSPQPLTLPAKSSLTVRRRWSMLFCAPLSAPALIRSTRTLTQSRIRSNAWLCVIHTRPGLFRHWATP